MKRQPPILITSSFLLPTDALMLAVVSDFGDITIPGLLYVQYSMGKPIKMRAAAVFFGSLVNCSMDSREGEDITI